MTIGADPGIVFLYITHPSMQLGAIVPADLWNALSKYLISQSCFFFFLFSSFSWTQTVVLLVAFKDYIFFFWHETKCYAEMRYMN